MDVENGVSTDLMDDGPALPSSLVELAMSRLRREIIDGTLAPGERIVEESVRRRFGISRAPLREALRLLAQQGLVEHLPRRGVRVATLSDGDVQELFELRDVLERHAVTKALPGAAGRLDGMRRELSAMEAAALSDDISAAADAHRRFHTELVRISGQSHLLSVYDTILLKLQLHMATNLRHEAELHDPLHGVHRHVVFLKAVESDDPEQVIAAMDGHGTQRFLTSGR